MKQSKISAFKVIRFFLIIAFFIGVVCIATYPFNNRNLKVCLIAEDRVHEIAHGNTDIASGDCKEIIFDEEKNSALIKKVRIYGESQTMLLKELTLMEFYSSIDSVIDGEVTWTEEGIAITCNDKYGLIMNDSYVEMLQNQSNSIFQERLIMIGIYFCVIALGWFLCSAVEEKKTADNWSNHGPLYETKKFIGDIKKYRQYIVFSANADLKAEVADSYLNRLWWLLEPFFNMIVYVIVFGNVMGNSVENYATFIFSALLMWNFFSKTVNYSVKLVRNNKDIISKVYIPKFIILLSNMILNIMKLLFSMIVLVIMMIVFRVEVGLNILWVIPAYLVIMLLAFGVGMIFMHFGVYVDDLSYAVGILLNMLMFLSGIFYETMTTLPEPLNALMMCLNPVAVTIDTMRNALLYNTASNLPLLGMWFLLSIVMCCIGVHMVYKNENSYVKIV